MNVGDTTSGDRSGGPGTNPETVPLTNGTGRRLLLYVVVSALTFMAGLLVSEAPGELALDVDLKPFFIPYLLIAAAGYGLPTFSIGIGAAVGEGIIDVFEGYELDDPIGFLGYAAGFIVFGWFLHRIADDPSEVTALTIAAVAGGVVQALFEGFAYYVFDPSSSTQEALLSVVGNTITHGILLGAVPLVVLAPAVVPWLQASPIVPE